MSDQGESLIGEEDEEKKKKTTEKKKKLWNFHYFDIPPLNVKSINIHDAIQMLIGNLCEIGKYHRHSHQWTQFLISSLQFIHQL